MGGGGGSKTVEVVEYVYEDPKHSITSQQMVDLFGHEQRQAGQQDIFQGADIVGRRAQPTPTVTEVARYLKDTTGASVISVPESYPKSVLSNALLLVKLSPAFVPPIVFL